MGSLADLKRKMVKGCALKMTFNSLTAKNNILNVVRYVIRTQTNGIYLNVDPNSLKGSFLEFPKASLMEFNGNTLKIFDPFERELTQEEKDFMENEPSDKKQDEIDMLSDGSTMFYRRKHYYESNNKAYLFGVGDKTKGLYYDINNKKIKDDSLKGNLSLQYEFI